jgi:hypothetical protein
MPNLNHVRVFNIPTERFHHTPHGLHLNKKGKNWIVNNLVKEIRNLYQPHKMVSPIVLPWKDVQENIPYQVQSHKECISPIPSGTVKDNMDFTIPNKNPDCQEI